MNWECSGYIASASDDIIRHMIVPNLVWRVGEWECYCSFFALLLMLLRTFCWKRCDCVRQENLFYIYFPIIVVTVESFALDYYCSFLQSTANSMSQI